MSHRFTHCRLVLVVTFILLLIVIQASIQVLTSAVDDISTQLEQSRAEENAQKLRCADLERELLEVQQDLWSLS